MSAGNHAQGVAYHAQRLGLRAVIVMPRFTPGVKIERTRGFGAEVVLHGDTLDESRSHALRTGANAKAWCSCTPTTTKPSSPARARSALEMLQRVPDLDTLVVAVGGGGLIAGMATAAKAIKPGIEVIGVQTCAFPAMVNAIKGTHLPQGSSTIAEGIAVGTPGVITAGHHRATGGRPGAGGRRRHRAGHRDAAGDREDPGRRRRRRRPGRAAEVPGALSAAARSGLVLCGGNIDPLLLAAIIERGMVRAGRLARIRVSARDVPGSLARITATVAEAGANIDEVHHQRAFTMLAAQNVDIELVIQTRGREHIRPRARMPAHARASRLPSSGDKEERGNGTLGSPWRPPSGPPVKSSAASRTPRNPLPVPPTHLVEPGRCADVERRRRIDRPPDAHRAAARPAAC